MFTDSARYWFLRRWVASAHYGSSLSFPDRSTVFAVQCTCLYRISSWNWVFRLSCYVLHCNFLTHTTWPSSEFWIQMKLVCLRSLGVNFVFVVRCIVICVVMCIVMCIVICVVISFLTCRDFYRDVYRVLCRDVSRFVSWLVSWFVSWCVVNCIVMCHDLYRDVSWFVSWCVMICIVMCHDLYRDVSW